MFSTLILRPALSLSICVLNVASAYTEYKKWEKQQKKEEGFQEGQEECGYGLFGKMVRKWR